MQVADLLRMESLVLQTLDFRVARPNAHTMLGLFRKAMDLGPRDAAFATYLVVSSSSSHQRCVETGLYAQVTFEFHTTGRGEFEGTGQ